MSTFDEFGRDRTLRTPHLIKEVQTLNLKYKGLSWAEIFYVVEEEEKQEHIKELQQKIKNQGTYELEEGEIAE